MTTSVRYFLSCDFLVQQSHLSARVSRRKRLWLYYTGTVNIKKFIMVL